MLPILPTGACILAGQLATVPAVVKIDAFDNKLNEPDNKTYDLVKIWS